MNTQTGCAAYESERPKASDFNHSMSVIHEAEPLPPALVERAAECRAKAEACTAPQARSEWMSHADELYAFLVKLL